MRPSRRVLLTTRLQASKSSCSSKSPLCVSVIALATAANTHLPSCRSREQHQNCQQQLTITSLLASGTRPPSAPQVSLQHRQHRRSPGLHRGNDRLEEAKLGVTLLRGECQTRQFLTATATGAIDATRQIHGRSDTKIKQETKSRGVPSGNEDALCSDTSGGTRASLQERLGMTDDQAKALRVQLTDNKNMRSKPGDQFQLLGKEGNMTEPCWQRLTGEKREGRASLAWYLLEELEVNPARVKSLVVRNPATMLGKSTAAVEQVSRWLSEVMRYDKAQVAQFLVKFPQAGHLSVEANFVPKCRWLCDNLETDYKGVARILKAVPSLLGLSIQDNLEPRLRWLERRLGMTRAKAAKTLRTHPVIFSLSAEKKLEPMLDWLKSRMDLGDEEAIAMVSAAPTILCMNPDSGLEPKLKWLRDRLGLSTWEITKLVQAYPLILRRSVESTLEPKLLWLREGLRLSADDAKKLFLRHPTVTSASLDLNLKQKVPWLQNAFGLTFEDSVELLTRCPTLLHVSIDNNLGPTLVSFQEDLGASPDQLRSAILKNPRLVFVSLKGRLQPRVAALRAAGIKPLFKEHQHLVVMASGAEFEQFLERARTEEGSSSRSCEESSVQ